MNQYVQVKILARGTLGSVLLVREKRRRSVGGAADSESSCSGSSTLRVAKQVDLKRIPTTSHGDLQTEISQLFQLSSPNIVKYFGACVDQMVIHVILEFVDGEDLGASVAQRKQEGGAFTEADALSVAAQTTTALQHAHSLGIIHRDLRCENVFLSRAGGVKVGDFCVASVFQHLASRGISAPQHGAGQSGSARHLAPEVLEGSKCTFASDVWSLGVMLYTMLALRAPFQGFNPDGLVFKIVSTEAPPLPEGYSEDINEISRRTLQKTPTARPSTEELLRQPAMIRGAESPAPLPKTEPMQRVNTGRQRPLGPAEIKTSEPELMLQQAAGIASTADADAVDELLSALGCPSAGVGASSSWSLRDAPPIRGMLRVESCPTTLMTPANMPSSPMGMALDSERPVWTPSWGRSRLGQAGGNLTGERPMTGSSPAGSLDSRVAAAMAMDYLSPLDAGPPLRRAATERRAPRAGENCDSVAARPQRGGAKSPTGPGPRGRKVDDSCHLGAFDNGHLDDVMDELLQRERRLLDM